MGGCPRSVTIVGCQEWVRGPLVVVLVIDGTMGSGSI